MQQYNIRYHDQYSTQISVSLGVQSQLGRKDVQDAINENYIKHHNSRVDKKQINIVVINDKGALVCSNSIGNCTACSAIRDQYNAGLVASKNPNHPLYNVQLQPATNRKLIFDS